MKYVFFNKINKKDFIPNEDQKLYLNKLLKENILKQEKNAYILNSLYRIGQIRFRKTFAIFEDKSENELKNFSLDFKDLAGASDGDFVLIKRFIKPRTKSKGQVVEVLKSSIKAKLIYKNIDKFMALKENIPSSVNLSPKAYKDGDILEVSGEKNTLIGNIFDACVDKKLSLFLNQEAYRLEPYTLSEMPSMEEDTNKNKKRVDLTRLDFCTIDPATAKDHDDAIYYDTKTSTLYVAIADVSYFVKEGTKLDKQALKRATSIYFPNQVLPMLPFELSENLCSLKPLEERFAFVFKMKLDTKNLEVVHSDVFEALIISQKKYSYGRIDRVLENKRDNFDKKDEEIFAYLKDFNALAIKLRAKRMEKGFDFRASENKMSLDNTCKIKFIEETDNHSLAHFLVEEAMLLANVQASKKINTLGIFRIHEEPSYAKIRELLNEVTSLGIQVKLQSSVYKTITQIQKKAKYLGLSKEVDKLIIQAQQLAIYSPKNLGHFGLGFESYSHFTSPIRRYSDLVLHRILKTKQMPKNLAKTCEEISQKQRLCDGVVFDFLARKYARWAKENIGCELKARLVDAQNSILEVYDKKILGLRATGLNCKNAKLFSKCKIIIKSSDLITGKISADIKN